MSLWALFPTLRLGMCTRVEGVSCMQSSKELMLTLGALLSCTKRKEQLNISAEFWERLSTL